MAGEPLITVVGNATADAEIKFLPSGVQVCSFTLAATPRVKQGDNWTDGETVFYRVSVWRQMAENVVDSVLRGVRVLVHGRLRVRGYEKDGERRTSIEIDAEHVGLDLRYATAKASKVTRSAGDTAGGTDDAWSTIPAAIPAGADEPPF